MITYQSGQSVVECPFCHKVCVTAFHKPSFAQRTVSRTSGKSANTFQRKEESYTIAGDCPNCGAKNKDIQKWYDGMWEDKAKLTHEERIRRLKEAGLPTRFEG